MAAGKLTIRVRASQSRVRLRLCGAILLLSTVSIVTLIPLGFLIVNSFNEAPLASGFKLGLEGWRQAFNSPQTFNALKFSFLLSTRTFIGLFAAFLVAWLLVRVRIPGRNFIEFSLWMAWFLPPLSVTIGWIALLDPHHGLINVLLAQVLPIPSAQHLFFFRHPMGSLDPAYGARDDYLTDTCISTDGRFFRRERENVRLGTASDFETDRLASPLAHGLSGHDCRPSSGRSKLLRSNRSLESRRAFTSMEPAFMI